MATALLPNYQRSITALDRAIDALGQRLDTARAAGPDTAEALAGLCDDVVHTASAVREAVFALAALTGESAPAWTTRAELDALAARLAARAEARFAERRRERLREIAVVLHGGRVFNRKTRRVNAALEQSRTAAAAEVARLADAEAPPALPGPADRPWLDWVWEQPPDMLEAALSTLREPAPTLYQFLLDLDPDNWQAPNTPTPPPPTLPPAAPEVVTEAATPEPEPVAINGQPGVASSPVLEEAPVGNGDSDVLPNPINPPQPSPPPEPPVARPLPVPEPARKPPAPPAVPPDLAGAAEISAYCVRGAYLDAALLAAGRAFGGQAETELHFDAVLLAQHVAAGSPSPPWPVWCYDPAAATTVAETAVESARLVFLAAQCHQARAEGSDPVAEPVLATLLDAFNDLPPVRSWLNSYIETTKVPGLWEQVCRPAGQDPTAEYQRARKAFVERYDGGLLHRNPKAAYIHRLDHFLSRLPAVKLVRDHLGTPRPITASSETRRQVAAFLGRRPEAFAEDWLDSTERTSGKIKLKGNDRANLVRRAAEYLEVAGRAWHAAETVLRAPAAGDIERRRKQLRELLPPARAHAEGRPWQPLFARLVGGLSS